MLNFSQDKGKVARLVADPNTFATTLHVIALTFFGSEIYDWEPEMFEMEFRDEFGVELSAGNQDRLNALITAVTTDAFRTNYLAFTNICEALNGGEADFENFSPDLLPAEMAWGVIEVKLSDSDPQDFGPDVAAFVGALLREGGFAVAPSQLGFAKMPEEYLGSTPGPDMNQRTAQNLAHFQLIDEYIQEQSGHLFDQLKSLPWVTDDIMSKVVGEIRQMSFRQDVIPAVPVL